MFRSRIFRAFFLGGLCGLAGLVFGPALLGTGHGGAKAQGSETLLVVTAPGTKKPSRYMVVGDAAARDNIGRVKQKFGSSVATLPMRDAPKVLRLGWAVIVKDGPEFEKAFGKVPRDKLQIAKVAIAGPQQVACDKAPKGFPGTLAPTKTAYEIGEQIDVRWTHFPAGTEFKMTFGPEGHRPTRSLGTYSTRGKRYGRFVISPLQYYKHNRKERGDVPRRYEMRLYSVAQRKLKDCYVSITVDMRERPSIAAAMGSGTPDKAKVDARQKALKIRATCEDRSSSGIGGAAHSDCGCLQDVVFNHFNQYPGSDARPEDLARKAAMQCRGSRQKIYGYYYASCPFNQNNPKTDPSPQPAPEVQKRCDCYARAGTDAFLALPERQVMYLGFPTLTGIGTGAMTKCQK